MDIPDNLRKYLAEMPVKDLGEKLAQPSHGSEFLEVYDKWRVAHQKPNETLLQEPRIAEIYNSLSDVLLPGTPEQLQVFVNVVDKNRSFAGLYISRAINDMDSESVEMWTAGKIFNHLGYKNTKNLSVYGKVYDYFATQNRGNVVQVGGMLGYEMCEENSGDICTIFDANALESFSQNRGRIMVIGDVLLSGKTSMANNYGEIYVLGALRGAFGAANSGIIHDTDGGYTCYYDNNNSGKHISAEKIPDDNVFVSEKRKILKDALVRYKPKYIEQLQNTVGFA